jgi:hypothetical protein
VIAPVPLQAPRGSGERRHSARSLAVDLCWSIFTGLADLVEIADSVFRSKEVAHATLAPDLA